jgi:hypothetical protein
MEVVRAIEKSSGVAKGTVEHVHDEARVIEVSIC